MAIALAIPAHLAALYALLARPDRVTHSLVVEHRDTQTVVHLPAPPVMLTVPAPPAPVATSRVCPAPNRTALHPVVPDLPAVDHVYASPTNADWLVAWNEASIYSSRDGGRTFDEILIAPGRVHSVALDCFGHAIAARGTKIGVRDELGETWHEVPGIETTDRDYAGYPSRPPDVWILGGGPDVVVAGLQAPYSDWKPRVAISSDRARSWSYRDLGAEGFEGTHLAGRQLANGRIDLELEIVDCGGEWMETYTIANGEVTRLEESGREPWRDGEVSTDAAGRRWSVVCGQLAMLAKNERPVCEGDDE